MQPALNHKHDTISQLLPLFVQQQLLGSWLWDKPQWPVCIADMKHPFYLTATQNYNHQYSPVILTSLSTVPFIFHGTFLQQLYNMNALAVPATPIQTNKKTPHLACWKPTCLHLILVYQYFWRKDQFQAKYFIEVCAFYIFMDFAFMLDVSRKNAINLSHQ